MNDSIKQLIVGGVLVLAGVIIGGAGVMWAGGGQRPEARGQRSAISFQPSVASGPRMPGVITIPPRPFGSSNIASRSNLQFAKTPLNQNQHQILHEVPEVKTAHDEFLQAQKRYVQAMKKAVETATEARNRVSASSNQVSAMSSQKK